MTDRELLELIAKQVGVLTGNVSDLTSEVGSIKEEVSDVKKTVLNIEQDHGKKLSALFDGYIQNRNKLDRIEKEVSKHDEFILKRVT